MGLRSPHTYPSVSHIARQGGTNRPTDVIPTALSHDIVRRRGYWLKLAILTKYCLRVINSWRIISHVISGQHSVVRLMCWHLWKYVTHIRLVISSLLNTRGCMRKRDISRFVYILRCERFFVEKKIFRFLNKNNFSTSFLLLQVNRADFFRNCQKKIREIRQN